MHLRVPPLLLTGFFAAAMWALAAASPQYVYRLSRNPMYLGFLGLVVGWAVYLSHVPAAILGPAGFMAYLNRYQIVAEERALQRVFGGEYEAYCESVRRWL